MKIIYEVDEARRLVNSWRTEGLKVGFVPTMGYLHEGHRRLIERASKENDRVVVSVFVNARQFGPGEDLAVYPKDLEGDRKLCLSAGVSMIFQPSHQEMYPKDFSSLVDVEGMTEGLCGKSRKTHFRGVCTVLVKLFHIIPAHRAYFGKKDAQQLAVVKKMVSDLNFELEIVECDTVREMDGLAKSSRNSYLNQEERCVAPILRKALISAERRILEGEKNASRLQKWIWRILESEKSIIVDYVEIVDSKSLKPVDTIQKNTLVAIAVFIGNTRLIDNFTYIYD